ncbi:OmpH family outer membrane protein [Halalkalibaculum sp. DA3122]|uniref:OmpH family outer membrane protein n=1 Tax=Halalkalibaculum sp. DA3122 TaxID=3373607 RepID=UPI0037552E4E
MKCLTSHNWKLLCLAVVGCLSVGTVAEAQEQKIGYVNTDTILQQMPEYKGIDQKLRTLSQKWKKELEQMQNEIEQLKQDFSDREILFTEEVRNQRQQEIRRRIQERQQYREEKFGAEGEYFQQQKVLLEPIQRRVFRAINVVAERNGYDFVFDRAADTSMLYFRQEWNLNDEVLMELDINTGANQTSN